MKATWAALTFALALIAPGAATATLTVTPVTWNVIGLDSNAPASGPRHFPVGARVCSDVATTNVNVAFVWDSANPNVDLRPGSLGALVLPSIGAGACADAYFEVEVAPVAAAFDTTRRYHIAATDSSGTASTPQPRELYVEHLISQNRNAVTGIKVDGASIPPGGSVGLVVGNTYTIELDGGTATQGYNQFESFINFSNAIFQILSVQTTYSANNSPYVGNPNDKLYADACLWENHPASANYRSCVGGDFKAGGQNVVTVYTLRIVGGGGTSQALSTLLYDFSGSSYHYNADFGVRGVIANIVDPTAVDFAKTFAPSATAAGGTSTLTFTITNPGAGAISGLNFSDSLPAVGGGQMVVASPATFSTSGCGAPVFAPVAGAASVAFANGSVAGNGTCTVSVRVSVPSAPTTGTYANTSNALFVGSVNTGKVASAALALSAASPGASSCGLTLAQWTMPPAQGTAVPPAFSSKASDVASAVAAAGSNITNTIDTAIGNPVNAWEGHGWSNSATPGANDYLQFAVTTSNYTAVTFSVDVARSAQGPTSMQLSYSTDGVTFIPYGGAQTVGTTFTTFSPALPGPANASGLTYFRVIGYSAANSGTNARMFVDNVTIGGCQTVQPPTLTKGFAPNPIAVGGVATLTFTLANPNATSLSGLQFTDTLPAGTQVAAVPSSTTNCAGSPTWAPTAGATALAFGQVTGATLAAGGACTVSVDVTATTTGPHVNVSGFVSSTEGGTNSTGTGSASATLTANAPPTLRKDFAPNPVATNQVSMLTFTITNPNAGGALNGVAFNDTYPSGLVNANPLVPAVTNTCAGTVTATAGGNGIQLSGGSVAAGGSCTIEVPVTAASVGTYANTSGPISDAAAGTGNAASATLTVNAPAPSIRLSKKVGASPTGPWLNFLVVAPASNVYYQFIVENTGDVALNPFSVSDPILAGTAADPATCVWQTANVPPTLPALPAASPTLDPTATCVVGPVPAIVGNVTNTATAHGTFGGNDVVSLPMQASYLGAPPIFSLVKEIAATATGPWSASITVGAGADVYYRFTLANNGALPLSTIGVSDPLISTASCAYVDPLPVGASSVCTVGPATAAGAPGSTTVNTATASGTNGSTFTTPPASASYAITPGSADLAITKSDGVTSLVPGSTTSYTLSVQNNGPDAVTGAVLADPVAAGLSKTAVTCSATPGQCVAAPSVAQLESGFALPALPSGATYEIVVTANVIATGGTVTNTATITTPAGIGDPVPANNQAGDTDTVAGTADLAIAKSNGVSALTSGTSTAYTITVTNNGPDAVTGALLSDAVAPGLTKTSVACSASPGQCATPPTIAELEAGFPLPALASGATYEIVVTATVTAPSGTVTNVATVASPAGFTDATPANNSASDSDAVISSVILADVSINNSDGVSSVTAGGATIYTIVATNNGPTAVSGATVTDVLPAEIAGATWTCVGSAGGLCPASGSGSINAIVDLPVGASVTFTLTAQIASAAAGTLVTTAQIAVPAGISDPTPGNNVATDIDGIGAEADLAVTKTDSASAVIGGTSTAYTITVTNNGPSQVTAAMLTDAAAPGLSKVAVACSATPGQCTSAPSAGQLEAGFALPVLASGATYQIVVTANVTAGSGNVTNTATVAPPVGVSDPTPGNNAATDTDSVSSPALVADLAIVKTNAGSALVPGGSTVYVITVTNNGPAEVTNASVTDIAPAGLTLGSWTCAVTAPGSGGSVTTACGAANGFGNLETTVTMKAGAVIAYTVQATVGATVSGSITNVATVSAPPGVLDPTSGNATSAVTVPVGQAATRPQPIPTLSTWGLMALSLLLAAGAIGSRRSRRLERSRN